MRRQQALVLSVCAWAVAHSTSRYADFISRQRHTLIMCDVVLVISQAPLRKSNDDEVVKADCKPLLPVGSGVSTSCKASANGLESEANV